MIHFPINQLYPCQCQSLVFLSIRIVRISINDSFSYQSALSMFVSTIRLCTNQLYHVSVKQLEIWINFKKCKQLEIWINF